MFGVTAIFNLCQTVVGPFIIPSQTRNFPNPFVWSFEQKYPFCKLALFVIVYCPETIPPAVTKFIPGCVNPVLPAVKSPFVTSCGPVLFPFGHVLQVVVGGGEQLLIIVFDTKSSV